MANYGIKINLQKLGGAFLTNLKGKTTTKKCLCIPIEDANLYVGEKGTYVNLTAIAVKEQKFDQSHCVKQDLPREIYEHMTDEERKAQPIIGNMHEFVHVAQEVKTVSETENEDDLPF